MQVCPYLVQDGPLRIGDNVHNTDPVETDEDGAPCEDPAEVVVAGVFSGDRAEIMEAGATDGEWVGNSIYHGDNIG